MIDRVLQDVRQAARALRQQPLFALSRRRDKPRFRPDVYGVRSHTETATNQAETRRRVR